MAATHGPARAAWRCGRRVTRRARQSPLKSSELLLHRTNAGSGASALYAEPDNRRQRPGAARRATHATTQLYRSFLLHEVPRLARYRHQRLVVPTRLVIGEHDMIASPALLDGWQTNADHMSVEVLDDVGHFIPDEAPAAVAAHVTAMFG